MSLSNKKSLGLRLLKIVFSIYLFITAAITILQMTNEYLLEEDYIKKSLASSQAMSQEVLTTCIWNFDQEALNAIVNGILKQPFIVGIEIINPENETLVRKGRVLNTQNKSVILHGKVEEELAYEKLFPHSFSVFYHKDIIANVVLYSSSMVVFNKVKYNFLVIIINSIIKTVILWLLFLWAFDRFVTKQMDLFCRAMEKVDIDNEKGFTLQLETFETYELSRIEFFFNKLVNRIFESHQKLNMMNKALEQSNETLEQKIEERTLELNNTINLIKKDLSFAKKIQSGLLPGNTVEIEDTRITSKYIPLDEVGGDFFDIARLNDYKVRVIIADATGHGVQAALITMLIKSEYETLKESYHSPALLLNALENLFFSKYNNLNSFFSCFIADIDLKKESLVYSSAGHPGQILISENSFELLHTRGRIIGVTQNSVFKETKVDFRKGDKLLLFTDGLYEEFNVNEEEFGEERVKEIIMELKKENIETIMDSLLIRLKNFLGSIEQQDDVTLIGIE